MGKASTTRGPTRALVLAAGYGNRLRPLTDHQPKALLPFWGIPMLDRCVHLLGSWGVRDVIINAHHLPAQVADAARRLGQSSGLRIALSFEPELLGTGGALKRVEGWLEEPLWIMNADVAARLDPRPLLAAWRSTRAAAVLWMHAALGPRTVERDGVRITNFRSKRPATEGTSTFCGLQLLDPSLRAFLPCNERFETLVDLYERALAAGRTVIGVEAPGAFWADIGTPEQYLEAHRAWWERYRDGDPDYAPPPALEQRRRQARARGGDIRGFAAIGEHVQIAPGAVLEDVVLGDGCRVQAGARARALVAAPGTVLSGPARRLVVPAGHLCSPREQTLLQKAGLLRNGTSAQPLPPRGSARSFARLQTGRQRVMLVRQTGQKRLENDYYARHTRFLARLGVQVPSILLDRPGEGLLAMEDLGDRSLQDVLPDLTAARRLSLYRKVIDQALILHKKGLQAAQRQGLPLMPGFDRALYGWEHDLFFEQFAVPARGPGVRTRSLQTELDRLVGRLLEQPLVLLHRDLQSSNVLLHRGRACLIDYQGMRTGPAVYDIASLLCDPYAKLEEADQCELLSYYQAAAEPGGDRIRVNFAYGAVQRLLQALGAYGRLSRLPGCRAFAGHIPSALLQLRLVLAQCKDLPRLSNLCESLTA